MAGTVVQTYSVLQNSNIRRLEFAWVADAAASVPDTASEVDIDGYVELASTIPGAGVAPTNLYDIVLEDEDGVDVMGGELANRAAAANEQAIPAIGNGYGRRLVKGKITMKLSNNAVNSATGTLVVHIARA